jgi:hypothetical protein
MLDLSKKILCIYDNYNLYKDFLRFYYSAIKRLPQIIHVFYILVGFHMPQHTIHVLFLFLYFGNPSNQTCPQWFERFGHLGRSSFFFIGLQFKTVFGRKSRGGLVVNFAPYASKSRNGARTSCLNVALSFAFRGLFENGRASTLFILNIGQTYHSEVGGNK